MLQQLSNSCTVSGELAGIAKAAFDDVTAALIVEDLALVATAAEAEDTATALAIHPTNKVIVNLLRALFKLILLMLFMLNLLRTISRFFAIR